MAAEAGMHHGGNRNGGMSQPEKLSGRSPESRFSAHDMFGERPRYLRSPGAATAFLHSEISCVAWGSAGEARGVLPPDTKSGIRFWQGAKSLENPVECLTCKDEYRIMPLCAPAADNHAAVSRRGYCDKKKEEKKVRLRADV